MVNAEYYEKQIARIGKRLKAARAEYMKEYWQGELASMVAAQQTYALDGATCPAHGLKLVDGYCPSLTCIYSPPRK